MLQSSHKRQKLNQNPITTHNSLKHAFCPDRQLTAAFHWVHISLKKVEGFIREELLNQKILLDKPWYVYDLPFAMWLTSLAGISIKRFCGNCFCLVGVFGTVFIRLFKSGLFWLPAPLRTSMTTGQDIISSDDKNKRKLFPTVHSNLEIRFRYYIISLGTPVT